MELRTHLVHDGNAINAFSRSENCVGTGGIPSKTTKIMGSVEISGYQIICSSLRSLSNRPTLANLMSFVNATLH